MDWRMVTDRAACPYKAPNQPSRCSRAVRANRTTRLSSSSEKIACSPTARGLLSGVWSHVAAALVRQAPHSAFEQQEMQGIAGEPAAALLRFVYERRARRDKIMPAKRKCHVR